MTITSAVNAGAAPQSDSVESASDLTVADVRAAISAGAPLRASGERDGWTILMSAALSNGNPEALQALIDARDREGWSALMAAAAFNQDPQVGRLLLAAGAETKPGGSVGTRALIMPGWPEEITAAGEAIGEAGIAAFELTPGGEPAVLAAALYGQNLDVLQALIDAGADILGAHTTDGWTAAMAAAFNPNPDVMQFLIDAGVDIHARTRQGWTAVRYADRFNPNSLVAQTLFDAGARLETVETAGTPKVTCAGSVAVGEAPNSAGLISDCEALLRASDALDGGAGVLDWDLDTPIGDWTGVSLRADRVIGLDLREAGLQGQLPAALADLSELEDLDLGDNELTGDIPPELSDLANLWGLPLDENQLSGSIPAAVGQIGTLVRLWLSDNLLTSPIPPSVGTLHRLDSLWLHDNQLTGSIPPELGDLTNLEELFLYGNRLTGFIPGELSNLRNLEDLCLDDNRLYGTVPPWLGSLRYLESVRLDDNELTAPYQRNWAISPTSSRYHLSWRRSALSRLWISASTA